MCAGRRPFACYLCTMFSASMEGDHEGALRDVLEGRVLFDQDAGYGLRYLTADSVAQSIRKVIALVEKKLKVMGKTLDQIREIADGVSFLVADAEKLPLPDRSVDTVSMAFGLRNCTDKAAVLAEARRVLKPGGRFLCLEFSAVQIAALVPLYDAWSFKVLPRLGQAIAGDGDSYQYLAESIRMFPDQQTLATMFAEAGFKRVKVRNLSGGIAAIHSGWRL